MKTASIYFFIFVFVAQSFAELKPVESRMRLEFNESSDTRNFTFWVPDGRVLVESTNYTFSSSRGNFYAKYIGEDQYGNKQFGELIREVGGDGASNEKTLPETPAVPTYRNTGTQFGRVHNSAIRSAVNTGMARAAYRGLIDSDSNRKEINDIESRVVAENQAIEANYQKIVQGLDESETALKSSILEFKNSVTELANSDDLNGFTYGSPDSDLVYELTEIEKLLRSSRKTDPTSREARNLGLQMVLNADEASTAGDAETAKAYRLYADAFLDIVVGIDPVTGTVRDVYEAFSGKNLITGAELDTFEHSFAILGAVTLGFGSKFGKGLKLFAKLKKSAILDKSLQAVERMFQRAGRDVKTVDNAAHNAATYQQYLRDLRYNMERPHFQDPNLQKYMINEYWKDSGTVGNKSTSAAIRHERTTGKPVGGRWHSLKGKHALTYFKNALQNKNLSSSDRRNLENLVTDLEDTFGGLL